MRAIDSAMAMENRHIDKTLFSEKPQGGADRLSGAPWLPRLLSVEFDKTTVIPTRPLGNNNNNNNNPANDGAC